MFKFESSQKMKAGPGWLIEHFYSKHRAFSGQLKAVEGSTRISQTSNMADDFDCKSECRTGYV